MPLKHPVLEYYKDSKKEWRWRFRSKNGKIIATGGGDGYKTRQMAEKGFAAFVKAAATEVYAVGETA